MAWIGGVSGATVAAAEAERMREEEEQMTHYTTEELEQDWEFKIVRSALYAFRNPKTLRRLVEEEARAGWVMVEKFDDSRIRFKRPRSAHERDHLLPPGIDPYRTDCGFSQGLIVALIVGLVLGLALLAIVFVVLAV